MALSVQNKLNRGGKDPLCYLHKFVCLANTLDLLLDRLESLHNPSGFIFYGEVVEIDEDECDIFDDISGFEISDDVYTDS